MTGWSLPGFLVLGYGIVKPSENFVNLLSRTLNADTINLGFPGTAKGSKLDADYVSSPLVVYNARGDAYLIACDRDGGIRLYDAARPGENALFAMDLGERIDATPAAYGNYIVVATTGTTEQTRVFCLKLN